jgi:simple sugar transport system ATP-binding protein
VEILKSLYSDVSLLILDEPTAVLSPAQREELFSTLRVLVDDGLTIILITHKLESVTAISDEITVLRDGVLIDTVETESTTNSELVEMMVGRDVEITQGGFEFENDNKPVEMGSVEDQKRAGHEIDEPILESRNLGYNDGQRDILQDVNIAVSPGEIVGIAGVSGNGQKELVECLAGLRDISSGDIIFKNTDVTGKPPNELIENGLSYVPEDRLEVGCAPDQSVTYNAIMKDPKFKSDFIFNEQEAQSYASDVVDEFDVRVSGTDVPAGKLSGGNLQKLIVGREMALEPDVLIANKPTRGLDVGAIDYIFSVLTHQRDTGMGILMVSGELDHLLRICDRILVIYEGKLVHQTDIENADKELISRYMTDGSR